VPKHKPQATALAMPPALHLHAFRPGCSRVVQQPLQVTRPEPQVDVQLTRHDHRRISTVIKEQLHCIRDGAAATPTLPKHCDRERRSPVAILCLEADFASFRTEQNFQRIRSGQLGSGHDRRLATIVKDVRGGSRP